LSVAMDRMRNTVETINNMPVIHGKYNDDAIEFVSWIFYLDMLIACIEAVAKSFSVSITYDKDIFLKYHNQQNRTDMDFFRFIRAIVLPHALENEQYDKKASIMEKCTFLTDLTIKYGDLNDKSGLSFVMDMLERCQKILSVKFYGKNKKVFDKYLIALYYALDDYYTYMCNQSNDETLLAMVLSPWHDYTSKTDFDGLGYEINKISAEMENFGDYERRYYFNEYYEALKPVLSTKVCVSKRMSMERVCYLTIIAFFFDRLKYNENYRKAFESVLDKIAEG